MIKAYITKMPHERDLHIRNIKALREAWVLDTVGPDGRPQCLHLKEAKHIADYIRDTGRAWVEIPTDMIKERLKNAGFVLEIDGMPAADEARSTLIAVRQLIQEALDRDDIDMLESLVTPYRMSLDRAKRK